MPLDYASRGDKVHSKMCEYMAARSIVFNDETSRHDYRALDFPALLRLLAGKLLSADSPLNIQPVVEAASNEPPSPSETAVEAATDGADLNSLAHKNQEIPTQ